jgi:hypothetical protein
MDGLEGYGYFIVTYLMFGLMGTVDGLIIPAVIGIIIFTSGMIINYLMQEPSVDGSRKMRAEDLCGCRLKI